MPNTLIHMGVGRLAGRALFQDADDKWIYIGCILPDIPWILQRIAISAVPGIDPVNLRLYCVIQASLFFSLLLGTALSLWARKAVRVWLILGFSCTLHLLLDAAQIKWANGVHLLAPFSWQMISYGIFWPESLFSFCLTVLCLFVVLWAWPRANGQVVKAAVPSFSRLTAGIAILFLYLLLPLVLLNGPARADNHFTATLQAYEERPGRPIAFDRCRYDPESGTIVVFTGEQIRVTGVTWPGETVLSLKGRFITSDLIEASAYHVHHRFRDASSLLGLALVAILWFIALWKNDQLKLPY